MVNVNSKMCENCKKKRPSYNAESETTPKYCKDCASSDMVNVKHRKCDICKKTRPSYNEFWENTPKYCKECASVDMVNIASRKCETCKKKQPSFNHEHEKTPKFCKDCALPCMIDIVKKRCITKHCEQFAQRDCEKRCIRCFRILYPWLQPLHVKSKEVEVYSRLIVEFGVDFFEYNKRAVGDTSCLQIYPDFFFKCKDHTVIFECDERQHRDRDPMCERVRTRRLQENQNQPIYLIRLNPDAYTNSQGKKIPSCFREDKRLGYQVVELQMQVRWEARLKIAMQTIRECFEYPQDGKPITEVRLFYDAYDDEGDYDTSRPQKRARESYDSMM